MTYSNPLQMLMQMGGMPQMQNPLQQMMQMGKPQQLNQPINHEQFIASASKFDKQTLAGLVSQARAQGIQEADIEQGLNFLLNLRK